MEADAARICRIRRSRERFGMPIFYECDRCTACCRWPGQVKVTADEIARLAAFLGISEQAFIDNYTRLAANRAGLALMDRENGECVFLEGNDCRVNPVKPQQCRNFPNLWNFPGFEKVCRAKAVAVDDEEYARRIAAATGVCLQTNQPRSVWRIDGIKPAA